METKTDTLAEKMEEFLLITKTSYKKSCDGDGEKMEKVCSYCKESGQFANCYLKNSHRNTQFLKCGKKEHNLCTCCAKNKYESVNLAQETFFKE